MKTLVYFRKSFSMVVFLLLTTNLFAQIVPTITGPAGPGMKETIGGGITEGVVYFTEPGMTNYQWVVSSPFGQIIAGGGTETITVTWTNPTGQQFVSVTYNESTAPTPTVLTIHYYPFPDPIDPTVIPQFVDALPHFAAGLRVNAKAGGNLTIKAALTQQIALSTGTPLQTGVIGSAPGIGMGNYAGYAISTDGINFGPTMWPAQTIEAQQGFPLQVQFRNDLFGVKYDAFNILADQTLTMNGYDRTGDPLTDPYRGDIPMVVHLHGGEMPSGSDGGPNAWFTPGYAKLGPGFQFNASSLSTYPNMQEATTLWYHPHDDGLTRINVYTGLAGYYFLRGADEEAAHFPGWSGDDLVQEVAPAGKNPSPFSAGPYLPEVEIAIQDRMFNVKGELYWPVDPPNPEIHPFWTPEFVGDVMTVNGKSWPYLSVAPRKYRFRVLEGCNARFLNMWLVDAADGVTPGPKITIIGGEGGLLASPVDLDPALGEALLMAPGQRYDVIVDFTGLEGKTFTLMNNAGSPYPFGDPVVPGLTDRIMQFVVNGTMVSAANPLVAGTDKGVKPAVLRPVTPLVALTDFAGNLSAGVTPAVKRQIVLNEVSTEVGGPAAVLVNNFYFDAALAIPGTPILAGGPTELPVEGTTETFEIINISADAHPIHIHLLQWQLVSRQAIDVDGTGGSGTAGYLTDYAAAFPIQEFPTALGYPGGAGSPYPYNTPNADGAVGGNPAVSPYLVGPVMPARPEERGWKDNVIVMPGEVTTFVVRVAPTDRPVNATPQELMFPFDPSEGPGYVWHCHIVDHEDMSMMRPLPIQPSPLRFPQITVQPAPVEACAGDMVSFSVTAASPASTTYQWQISTNGGGTWANLADAPPYSGSLTASLLISPAALTSDGTMYHCVLTNTSGITTSNAALLTVNDCSVSGTVRYNNADLDPLVGLTVAVNGKTGVTDGSGAFTIPGVTSGIHPVTVTTAALPGGINSTDAGKLGAWAALPVPIDNVSILSGDVNNDLIISAIDAPLILQNFVKAKPFVRPPWVFADAAGSGIVVPPALSVTVSGTSVAGVDILARSTGDFNGSFFPNAPGNISNVVLNNTGIAQTFAAGKQFDLPIKAVSAMQVGAVSLILTLPSNLVKLVNVRIPGSAGPAVYDYNTVNNEVRIGWNSTVPINVIPGQSLVVLTLLPTSGFTTAQRLTLGMAGNSLNELADATFAPIPGAQLEVDDVVLSQGSTLTLSSSPNPAKVGSTITALFTLPVAGNVTLALWSAKAQIGAAPVANISYQPGTWTYPINLGSFGPLKPGSYYLKLTLNTGTQIMTTSFKIMLN